MLESTVAQKAWVTLLSNTSYIPGCLTLQSSLKRCGTKYPLVVMVFPLEATQGTGLPKNYRDLLKQAGCVLREVDWLVPAAGGYSGTQTRYTDVWARLRAFGLSEYKRVILIDSDMLVRRNMDELFDQPLKAEWIAASHPCTCNPLRMPHYPSDWVPSNCGHTYAIPTSSGSEKLCTPFQPNFDSSLVLHSIGAGLVVLTPSSAAYAEIIHAVHNNPDVTAYIFPEQDFLAKYFKNRVRFLGYEYNAVKPMRECHKNLWRDEGVRNVHYVLKDKPWDIPEGSKLLEAQFQVVHGWWWDKWRRLESLFGGECWWELVAQLVASPETRRRMRCVLQ